MTAELGRLRGRGLHAVDGRIGMFAQELDPLLLEAGIVLCGFDQVHEASDGLVESLLQNVILEAIGGAEGLVRLDAKQTLDA